MTWGGGRCGAGGGGAEFRAGPSKVWTDRS